MADKAAAEQLKEACQGANVTIKKVERKEKSEKPPALYDLTTLQRDANRLLGFTAQQTLDYLQSLYEKKLCTYPRTDSRYLTGDMADSLPVLVNLVANAMPFRKGIATSCEPGGAPKKKKNRPPRSNPYPKSQGCRPFCPSGGRKSSAGAGGPAPAVRRGPAPYLFGNRRCCGVCRWGVYRQGKNGEAPRMEGTGGRLPFCAEKCGAGKKRVQRRPCRS